MEPAAYSDDPSIPDASELWRRIHPRWAVHDDNQGGWRVSSAAFADSRDGSPLSVLLADVVAETGRTADHVLTAYTGYSLASITAGTARSNQQAVARTPAPDEPAHASVFGRKTDGIRRALARSARWVVAPEGE